MSTIWLIPVLVLLVGGIAVAALARQAAEATREVLDELGRWRELQPALVELRASVERQPRR